MAPLSELDEAIWDKILTVNLKGAFLLCQRVAPLMTAAGHGSIVCTAMLWATAFPAPALILSMRSRY